MQELANLQLGRFLRKNLATDFYRLEILPENLPKGNYTGKKTPNEIAEQIYLYIIPKPIQ